MQEGGSYLQYSRSGYVARGVLTSSVRPGPPRTSPATSRAAGRSWVAIVRRRGEPVIAELLVLSASPAHPAVLPVHQESLARTAKRSTVGMASGEQGRSLVADSTQYRRYSAPAYGSAHCSTLVSCP